MLLMASPFIPPGDVCAGSRHPGRSCTGRPGRDERLGVGRRAAWSRAAGRGLDWFAGLTLWSFQATVGVLTLVDTVHPSTNRNKAMEAGMGTGRIILQAASLFVIFTALGFIAAALLRDAI